MAIFENRRNEKKKRRKQIRWNAIMISGVCASHHWSLDDNWHVMIKSLQCYLLCILNVLIR